MIAKDFMIGAATAAHQVEGNNIHSDYWLQENMPHTSFLEPSGIACDHYNRYKEDIKMMADAGLNAYRFSIEWARIEPEEGLFDENEINHYEDVINTCLSYNVKPIVTLMHFTSPAWLIKKGGWTSVSTVEYFRRYVSYVIDKLGSKLEFVCTINEANMGLQLAAISKRFKLMAEQAAKKADGTVQVGMNFEKMMENMKYAAMENAQIFGTPDPKIFVSSRDLNDDEIVIKAHLAAREEIKKLYPNIEIKFAHNPPTQYGLDDESVKIQMEYLIKIMENEKPTHFYSSEKYGASVAKYMNLIDRRVDEERINVPIRAEKIRKNVEKNKKWLERNVYEDFIKI